MVGIGGGFQIGMDVGAAKTVNRLFGIADQKQRFLMGDKTAVENFVLQRVGILEFIDQRHLPVFGNQCGQGFGVRAFGKGVVNIGQQIVEVALAAAFFLFLYRFAYGLQQVELECGEGVLFGLFCV